MDNKTLIIIALVGAAAFYLYTKSKAPTSPAPNNTNPNNGAQSTTPTTGSFISQLENSVTNDVNEIGHLFA